MQFLNQKFQYNYNAIQFRISIEGGGRIGLNFCIRSQSFFRVCFRMAEIYMSLFISELRLGILSLFHSFQLSFFLFTVLQYSSQLKRLARLVKARVLFYEEHTVFGARMHFSPSLHSSHLALINLECLTHGE